MRALVRSLMVVLRARLYHYPVMKTIRAFLSLTLVTISLVSAPLQPTVAVYSSGSASPSAIPAACVTRTRIQPRTPGWVFALNFDAFGAENAPLGCLMLYRTVLAPTDFAEVPCKAVGNVAFSNGQATFTNGYIFCGVNIQERLAAFSPPAVVPNRQSYPYFTLIAAGTLSNALHTDPRSNPIGVYRANAESEPSIGLYVPLLANVPEMRSEFNGVANVTANNAIDNDIPLTFTVDHDGGPDVYTVTHFLNDSILSTFAPRGPVNFYTNGGAFWIGVSPSNLSRTFSGTLDEVIFDPIDGGRPPTFQHAQHLQFVPLAVKQ